MFTGIVQDCGQIEGVAPAAAGALCLTIRTRLASTLALGDSLCLNGVCLTVDRNDGTLVSATAVAETLALTTLSRLRRADTVNLEPALRVGDPLGGHIVQGHVDGTGLVVENGERQGGWVLALEVPAALQHYTVHKGSIALDGVSLTLAEVDGSRISVALVPHTLEQTVLRQRRPGDPLNLEVDVIAKYVERMLGRQSGSEAAQQALNEGRLRELGY